MTEIFRSILRCPEYSISNFGSIKSSKTGIILKCSVDKNGLLMARIVYNRKPITLYPHREVAENFIENSEKRRFVIHIDRNKLNNHISNLKWSGSVVKDEQLIKNLPQESWDDLFGFEKDYEASTLGRIYSKHTERIIIPNIDPNGYEAVSLRISENPSKFKSFRIHRLIAKTFISNLEGKPVVNHINAIRSDNRVENLEWVTTKENVEHAIEIGNMSNLKEKIALNIIKSLPQNKNLILISDLEYYLQDIINANKKERNALFTE